MTVFYGCKHYKQWKKKFKTTQKQNFTTVTSDTLFLSVLEEDLFFGREMAVKIHCPGVYQAPYRILFCSCHTTHVHETPATLLNFISFNPLLVDSACYTVVCD